MKRISLILLLFLFSIVGYLFYYNNKLLTNKQNLPRVEEVVRAYMQEEQELHTNDPKYVAAIDIQYLRDLNFDSPVYKIEEQLSNGSNYYRYIASYESDGYKIYGLLTVPFAEVPEGGFPAIVFNHGYIPPQQYVTTERYVSYVDNLARSGFVVFKIDMRGHGESEGSATGSYFSPGYTIDAINALKSLQKSEIVNPDRIGMWGHSMAGNLVMRAMLVEEDIKASVIWAGAVYSYEDFAKYRLNDTSYVRRPEPEQDDDEEEQQQQEQNQESSSQEPNLPSTRTRVRTPEVENLREEPQEINFNDKFWSRVSLTQNLDYLNSPVQLHHSIDDSVVNVGYQRDLSTALEQASKEYEAYEYSGGGHNINSPYFEQAMSRTIEFFKLNL